jgi:hydroxymethylglutaryl-CoA synthase
MSFLYVRGLSRGDHHQEELAALCAEARVSVEDVRKEALSSPDLYAQVSKLGADVNDPYVATSAVAGVLRKKAEFRQLLEHKMSLGSSMVRDLGNLYSAALPSWIAAGFAEAAKQGLDLTHRPMVAVGYGSGDAAEAWPIRPVQGFAEAAARIQMQDALDNPIDLTRQQYEALHDGHAVPGLSYEPRDEFVITHVGERYEPTFQDLAVEYYKYVA